MNISEFEKLSQEYLEVISAYHHDETGRRFIAASDSPIRIGDYVIFGYGGKKKGFAVDCDGSLNAITTPCFTENFFETLPTYNRKIDYSKIKKSEEEINNNPNNVINPIKRIFKSFKIGRLHFTEYDEASSDAALMTKPIRNAYEGFSKLEVRGWPSGIVSAAVSRGVDYFSTIKIGISRYLNKATKLLFDSNTGYFTGRYIFYYGENKPSGYRSFLKQIGGESDWSAGLSDEPISEDPFAAAVANGLFIWVDTDEKRREQAKKGLFKYPGRIVVYRPEIRENFELVVNDLSAMERVRAIHQISPVVLSEILSKVQLLKNQEDGLEKTNDIEFLTNKDFFINTLIEVLSAKLPFPKWKLNVDEKIMRLRICHDASEGRDLIASITQCLDTYLYEYDMKDEHTKRINYIARRWEDLSRLSSKQ